MLTRYNYYSFISKHSMFNTVFKQCSFKMATYPNSSQNHHIIKTVYLGKLAMFGLILSFISFICTEPSFVL